MEIAGFVVAVLAAVGAVVAAFYAGGANRRADEANRTAARALDLQARIDAREREFREVEWDCDYAIDHADRLVFRVKNTGHTNACQVTVVFWAPSGGYEIARPVGDIAAGESSGVSFETDMKGQIALEAMLLQDTGYRLHWSSPLGQVETYRHPGLQLR